MSVTDFEQRRKEILELIIEAHVSSASPGGSELVSRKLRSSLSSANRVPRDRGYRFYVDSVMELPRLSPDEMRRIELLIQPSELDVELLLQRASSVLAELSGQAAFAVAPTVKQSTIKQIELVPLSVRKILCVRVANEEMVASHV